MKKGSGIRAGAFFVVEVRDVIRSRSLWTYSCLPSDLCSF
jgi:hypothetical protein